MPMYSFACVQCGHKFEELRPIDRRDDVVCPKCGASVKRSYEGSCAFGHKSGQCGGNCGCCSGCGKHE